jgi:predicted dehydrogenase
MGAPTVALIGCGYHMTNTLAPAIRAAGALDVVAVCDQIPERATDVASRFPGSQPYGDAELMLNAGGFEAAIMAGPPQMHYELGRQALSRGIHIFVEKPAGADAAAILELAMLAEERKCLAVVGHNLRHSDAWKLSLDLSTGAEFGRIVAFHAAYLARAPRGSRWGLDPLRSFLLTHAVHPIDLAVSLFGRPVKTFAHSTAVQDDGLVLTAHLEFEAGEAATVVAGTAAPSLQLDTRFVSDRSHFIRVEGLRRVASSLVGDGEWGPFRQTSRWDLRTMESSAAAAGYQSEIEAFAEALHRAAPAHPSLSDVLPTYETLSEIADGIAVASPT